MKIKIFTGSYKNIKKLEEEVNAFIADKEVSDIKQSQTGGRDTTDWSLTITVLYEEENKKKDNNKYNEFNEVLYER